jgi:hypothetical protein
VRSTKTAGRSVTYRFTGRAVSFVSTRASSRGSARIYIDGSYMRTVSLASSTTAYRYLAFTRRWTTSGTHTIKVVVVGTAGHPRVDVDAFAVLK